MIYQNRIEEDTLYYEFMQSFKKHPYHGGHNDLIYLHCCEYDDALEEICCVLDKEVAMNIANKLFGIPIHDFNRWIENTYTSDESEPIIREAINQNAVFNIWRV